MEQYRTSEATAQKTKEEIDKLERIGWTFKGLDSSKKYDWENQSFYFLFSALLERADVAKA